MILRELVSLASGNLRLCGIGSSARDARALCAFALGIQPDEVSIEANMIVTVPQQDILLSIVLGAPIRDQPIRAGPARRY